MQHALLKEVVHVLQSLGVEYMLAGSTVSSLQGVPRSTHDIDIVANCRTARLRTWPQLSRRLHNFYLDPDAAHQAMRECAMFNMLDNRSGDTVDFWPLTADPFEQSRSSRKYTQRIGVEDVFVSRPDDTILAKLRWARLAGDSDRHIRDATHVYEIQHGGIDTACLHDWAGRLGVADMLSRVIQDAQT